MPVSPPVAPVAPVAVVVTAAYIAAQMLADIASVKIGTVAGLAVDMGTFVYPITFTLRDLVHKVLGKRNAQVLIITAALVNLTMAGYLHWAARVPADPSWAGQEGMDLQLAFGAILSPFGRIVLASIVAEVLSELLDTEVYHRFVQRFGQARQWARVLVSNAFSVPLDNLLFAVLAFGPFSLLGSEGLPWSVVWEIFLINLLVKMGVTLLSLPLIYLVPERFES
jgi:uncharacterized integral membrane protein (TIGR00697 family)